MPLESLTPNFDEDSHGTYLRRLEEAVKDPSNLNIALSGRYGAGKSSVLDKFATNHADSTLRLAISSLAPGEEDGEGDSTTNQIQKEIVKQLLYGATKKVGKNSRFRKIAVLSKPKAIMQSAVFVGCLGGLLYLFGALTHIKWTGASHDTWVRVVAWVGVAALATGVAATVRLLTAGRFRVGEVSAGGAAMTLEENQDSYFDEFLDEIVHYFGRESKDIVIFEDLDRFEDPGIFEELRELNLLLNETPERRRRRDGNRAGRRLRKWLDRKPHGWRVKIAAKLPDRFEEWLFGTGESLRFVYALRDGVFSKIEADTTAEAPAEASPGTAAGASDQRLDAAAAETLRANRTKFFDVVIPLVPFISHRNARDLLMRLLEARGITGIEPRLVNTIAHHCTDMRLMRNMCNEYLVFAERLLEPKEPNKPAPGMTASRLFALVAYKNFHLEDFENITRRDSDLDRLYAVHQQLVRDTIAAKDGRKRALQAEPDRVRTRSRVATMLGKRLTTHAQLLRRASNYGGNDFAVRVGSNDFDASDLGGYEFWAAVAQHQAIDITLSGNATIIGQLNVTELAVFAPEGLDADRWAGYDRNAVATELATIEADIEALRSAGFADLVTMSRFKLTPTAVVDNTSTNDAGSAPQTSAQLLETTLKSELACDLVRRGYIDRNFSLYAAQFYGNFTGVDVANFMVQHVQTNTMAIDYKLNGEDAVDNLLTEAQDAGEELTHTVAAFNIDIVNRLLNTDDPRADDVVDNLIAGWASQGVRDFLAAYFTSDDAEGEKLAASLAERRWHEVFTYLVRDGGVPPNTRPALVSAAACGFDPGASYDFDDDVRTFIAAHYRTMAAFTVDHFDDHAAEPAERTPERLNVLLERVGVAIPDLHVLGARLHQLVVNANRYDLTANNLRSALGIITDAPADGDGGKATGGDSTSSLDVPLDVVRDNEAVYAYCLDQLTAYLAAVDHDTYTSYAVITPETLAAVLADIVEDWGEDKTADPHSGSVANLLTHTSPDARLHHLRATPQATWIALAAADRFRASLANVGAYRAHTGAIIDAHLAALLERAGTVHAEDPDDYLDENGEEYNRQKAALALLNTAHLATTVRVALADSLHAETPLPVENITAAPNDLFALLLEHRMVSDELETFMRIREGGWSALRPAIAASTRIGTFLEPAVVLGMVSDLLADADAADKIGRIVLNHVDEYLPDDDWTVLRTVARYADTHHIPLAPATVARITRVAHANGERRPDLMVRLLCAASPGASADDIADVFEQLGPDYNKIRQPGARLKIDRNPKHDQLLKVLRAANRITRGTSRTHYSATVI